MPKQNVGIVDVLDSQFRPHRLPHLIIRQAITEN